MDTASLQRELSQHVEQGFSNASISKALKDHNKRIEKKIRKKIALDFINMRMKQLAPMAFVKNLPSEKQQILDSYVKFFIEDQQRQLVRRKGKPPNGTWMYV